MNFEKQICKQIQEQPAYIKANELLVMQRASMVRYDRTSNQMVLLPPFFSFTDDLISKVDKSLSEIAPIQRCNFYFTSDVDVSNFVSGQIRNVRPLPMILKQNPTVSTSNRPTSIPTKTSYDLIYYYFPDPNSEHHITSEEIAHAIAQSLQLPNGFDVISQFHGSSIIDRKLEDQISIVENPCSYEEVPPPSDIPPLEEIFTPDAHTIDDLAQFTKKPATELVKAVMYETAGRLIFVSIRGDLDVAEDKLRAFLGLTDSQQMLELAPEELLSKHGLVPGFTGPVNVKRASEAIIIMDNSVKTVPIGVTGACKKDYHFMNFNVERDTKKIAKFIKWADVAKSSRNEVGAVIADVIDLSGTLAAPNLLGLDNKPHLCPLFKITIRLVDTTAALLSPTLAEHSRKIPGVYIINMMKDSVKLNKAVNEFKKVFMIDQIVIDDRPKANFGVKNDTAKLSLFENIVVISNKLDDETISINDNPLPIANISTFFLH